MSSDQVEFESDHFAIVQHEDRETNPGICGFALAEWVAERLRARGVSISRNRRRPPSLRDCKKAGRATDLWLPQANALLRTLAEWAIPSAASHDAHAAEGKGSGDRSRTAPSSAPTGYATRQLAWLRGPRTFAYYGVQTNIGALEAFQQTVTKCWYRSLRRRSQRRRLDWLRTHRLAVRWLPKPRIVHPSPEQRLDVQNPR